MSETTPSQLVGQDREWLTVIGACLCLFCGQPAVVMYTFGIFVPEIVAATRWSPAAIASAIGPGALAASLLSPLVGWASDRFGTKSLALVGGPAMGIALAGVGLIPQSATTFVVFTAIVWILSFAGSPVPYAQMVTGWFTRKRGFALSIVFGCGALGIAVWPPYAAFLIAQFGWRLAYVGMGLTAAIVITSSAIFLLKDPPKVPAGAAAAGNGLTVAKALRTLRFWKVASVFLILTGVLAGAAVNLPILLRRQGIDAQTASLVMTTLGGSMFIGRLSLAPILDRWFAPYITIGIALLPIGAFVILLMANSSVSIFAAAALIGLGLGSEFNAAAYITGRAFGFRSFGAIYGLITMFAGFGGAMGPTGVGVALARHVDLDAVFVACLVLLGIAILILATIKRSDLAGQ